MAPSMTHIAGTGRKAALVILADRTILFSFDVPVAVHMAASGFFYRTAAVRSMTAAGHIGAWLGAHSARDIALKVSQKVIDTMASGGTEPGRADRPEVRP